MPARQRHSTAAGMLAGYAMAFEAFKLEESPAVGETKELSPGGEPCIPAIPLLGDCCPFPGDVLAGLQPMQFLLIDVQSTV